MCCQVRGALDRRWCDRSQFSMRSILGIEFSRISASAPCTFDCRHCVRLHCVRSYNMQSITDNYLRISTAQELKWWIIGPTRAMRETRVYVVALDRDPYARAQCFRSHQVRLIALSGIKTSILISPLFATNCINDLQHTKTLKQHKILDINTAKSLTNIS